MKKIAQRLKVAHEERQKSCKSWQWGVIWIMTALNCGLTPKLQHIHKHTQTDTHTASEHNVIVSNGQKSFQ